MTISSCTSYGLQEIYTSAIQELKVRKEKGGLSESDFELITNCSSLDDVLEQFQTLAQQHEEGKAKQKIWKIGESLVNQLERFGVAIDMLAQSMPEVAGVNPIGIIWGSFRFLLIVSSLYLVYARKTDRVRSLAICPMPSKTCLVFATSLWHAYPGWKYTSISLHRRISSF